MTSTCSSGEAREVERLSAHKLMLPSSTKGDTVPLFLSSEEYSVIINAHDSIHWADLSWSMRRGLHDILIAAGKTVMEKH